MNDTYKLDGGFKLYKENFEKAIEAFKHAKVYCPREDRIRLLQTNMKTRDYLGVIFNSRLLEYVISGDIHPCTYERFPSFRETPLSEENVNRIKNKMYQRFMAKKIQMI